MKAGYRQESCLVHVTYMTAAVCVFNFYLSTSVEFVGEFHFAEGNRRFHPVRTKVWGIRVDVDAAGALRLRFAAGDPLPVHVFPPVVVCCHKIQQHRVHGVRVEAADTGPEDRKHPPGDKRRGGGGGQRENVSVQYKSNSHKKKTLTAVCWYWNIFGLF